MHKTPQKKEAGILRSFKLETGLAASFALHRFTLVCVYLGTHWRKIWRWCPTLLTLRSTLEYAITRDAWHVSWQLRTQRLIVMFARSSLISIHLLPHVISTQILIKPPQIDCYNFDLLKIVFWTYIDNMIWYWN